MSPIYVPVILFILTYIDHWLAGSAPKLSLRFLGLSIRPKLANLVAAILVAILVFPILQVARAAGQQMRDGHDYMDASWRNSETVSFLQDKLLSQGEVETIYIRALC